ncbi:MAG: 2-hydroxy-3-oxopropionate reductase [Anaerolineales bacterium]|nr:2-hydroxy-3-oxopropionate reductase [Anaerolineales bacterium]
MTERIGFIGLGIMGKPMAQHLLNAGFPLTVLDLSQSAVDELIAAGARAGTSPKNVAAQSDVIITMLPDSPQVEEVILGKDGVLEGLRAGALVIDMSTILPSVARRVAQAVRAQGADALDAPVSGGEVGAKNATLTIMVGGAQAAFDRAKPIFEKMGKNITLVGEAGAGQITKAANQIIVAGTIAAVSEALLLAAKAGADPAKVREALMGGFASSRILELHGNRMIQRTFAPGFKIKLHRKDMNIVLNTARELGVALPISANIAEMMNGLIANGAGELDHSAFVMLLEKIANFEIGSGQIK